MYKQYSVIMALPFEDIPEEDMALLIEITDKAVKGIVDDNTFKSYMVTTNINNNIEFRGKKYQHYAINGFLPPHTLESVLNVFRHIVGTLGGKISINLEYIEDFDINWEKEIKVHPILKLFGGKEKVNLDIERQKRVFGEFKHNLESS